eukprot:761028-Hanusia_phi.AAC.3
MRSKRDSQALQDSIRQSHGSNDPYSRHEKAGANSLSKANTAANRKKRARSHVKQDLYTTIHLETQPTSVPAAARLRRARARRRHGGECGDRLGRTIGVIEGRGSIGEGGVYISLQNDGCPISVS